jgi:flagellar hook assembly protein FlgD
VEWSEMINHFTIEENTEDGSIRFAGMGTIPDGEEGIFATVSLFVSSDFNEESLDVTVNKSRINESEPIEDLVITFTNTVLSVDTKAIPKVYALRQNYPNPFNPTTQIKYDLPEDALVAINIYDLMGRNIRSLVNTNQSAGYRSIQWNATNNLGEPVSAGMYIYMIQAGEFRQTKKMVLLK